MERSGALVSITPTTPLFINSLSMGAAYAVRTLLEHGTTPVSPLRGALGKERDARMLLRSRRTRHEQRVTSSAGRRPAISSSRGTPRKPAPRGRELSDDTVTTVMGARRHEFRPG